MSRKKAMASNLTIDPTGAIAAIEFALEADEGLEFLRCWNEGDFETIRREWPEAPEAVFVGADPMHSVNAHTSASPRSQHKPSTPES